MPARRDGTEPMIVHGQVFLRPAEREDLPLFVRWFGDARTTRTLSAAAPMSLAIGGGLVRAGRRQPGPRRLPLRDLPPRGRPADRDDRAVRAGPAQRQRGPRDLDRRPGRHGPGLWHGRHARDRRLGLRHAAARADLARRLCVQPAGPRRLRAAGLRPRRDVCATARSGSASTWTSTGCRSSPASGERAPGPGPTDGPRLALRHLAAGELLEQPVDRVEERLRHLRRQRVPDGVLGPVRGPRPQRHAPEVAEVGVAQAVRAAARGRRASGRRPGRVPRPPAGRPPSRPDSAASSIAGRSWRAGPRRAPALPVVRPAVTSRSSTRSARRCPRAARGRGPAASAPTR